MCRLCGWEGPQLGRMQQESGERRAGRQEQEWRPRHRRGRLARERLGSLPDEAESTCAPRVRWSFAQSLIK